MKLIDQPDYIAARLKHQIAGNKAVLAAYRIGRLSEHGRRISRIVESEQKELEEQLRALTELSNKYDPNQPRVPSGNSDGGQWTDGGAGGVDPITTGSTLGAASSQPSSWLQSTVRQVNREIPLRSAVTNPVLRSATTLLSFLKTPELEYPIDQAIAQFNAIAIDDDPTAIPIISSRARAFTNDDSDTKTWASVRKADIGEVSKVCQHYFTVQTQTDIAAFAAGSVSNYTDAGAYRTRVHKILERQINSMFSPALQAEYVLWDALAEAPDNTAATRGNKHTLELDVFEKVNDDLVCIYDIKTGKRNFTSKRMSQLSHAVAKKYPGVKNFFTIQIRPSADAIIRGPQ
ncbi:hypothetical protein [Phyllobacterium sp. K27]